MDIISIIVGVGAGIALFAFIYLLFLKKKNMISDSELIQLRESEKFLGEQKHVLDIELSKLQERNQQSEKWLSEVKNDLTSAERSLIDSRERISAKDQVIKNLDEKLHSQKEELKNMGEQMRKDFENLANRIFEVKSEKFTRDNKLNLEQTLAPLKERLKEFQDKVEFTHKDNIEKSATLMEQIRGLKELNEQMSSDARHLTDALKGDSKTQGNWGELVLEKVLDHSGLKKGVNYIVQGTNMDLKDEEGKRFRPDVIVLLPDNKQVIIDSKVSLTAYERMVNSENDEQRLHFANEHVKSIKAHVVSLSGKQYHHLEELKTPDFTLMFLPVESSFSLAIQTDYELFSFAWDKKIVIVSPTTLFATLKTVASIWKQENQQRNAFEIARQGGALYDKFVSFVEDLKVVGNKIDESKKGYNDAMNKLVEGKGNLVRRVEKLGELGSDRRKQLPKDIIDKASSTDFSLETIE